MFNQSDERLSCIARLIKRVRLSIIMKENEISFLNGYIKTSLRLARKIRMAKTLDEVKEIATEIEEKAMKKLEETMGNL